MCGFLRAAPLSSDTPAGGGFSVPAWCLRNLTQSKASCCCICWFSIVAHHYSRHCPSVSNPRRAGETEEKTIALHALEVYSVASPYASRQPLLLPRLISALCSSACINFPACFTFCSSWLGLLCTRGRARGAPSCSATAQASILRLGRRLFWRICCCWCVCCWLTTTVSTTALQFVAVRWGNVTLPDGLSRQYRWTPQYGYQRVYIDPYRTALFRDDPITDEQQQETQHQWHLNAWWQGQQPRHRAEPRPSHNYWGDVLRRLARNVQGRKKKQQHQRDRNRTYKEKKQQQVQSLGQRQQGLYAYEPLLTSVSPDGKWLGILTHHCPRQDYLEQDNVQAAQGSVTEQYKDRPYSCSAFLYLYQTKGKLQSRTELLLPPGDTRIIGFALQPAAAESAATANAKTETVAEERKRERGEHKATTKGTGEETLANGRISIPTAPPLINETPEALVGESAVENGATAHANVVAESSGNTAAFEHAPAASVAAVSAARAEESGLLNLNLVAWRRAAPHGETCACKQEHCNIFFDMPRRAQCYEESYNLSAAAQLIWPSQTQLLCLHDDNKKKTRMLQKQQQQLRKSALSIGSASAAAQIQVPYCETPTLREDWTCADSGAPAAFAGDHTAHLMAAPAASHSTSGTATVTESRTAVKPCRELPLLPGTTVGTYYLGNMAAEEPAAYGSIRATFEAAGESSGSGNANTTSSGSTTNSSGVENNGSSKLTLESNVHTSHGQGSSSGPINRDSTAGTQTKATRRNVQVDVQQKNAVINLLRAFDDPATYNDLRVLLPSNPHRNRVVLRMCTEAPRGVVTAAAPKTYAAAVSLTLTGRDHIAGSVARVKAAHSSAAAPAASIGASLYMDHAASAAPAASGAAALDALASSARPRGHSAVLLDTLAEYTSPTAAAGASLKVLPSCFVLHTYSSAEGFTPNAAVAADGSCSGCSNVGVVLPRTCGGPVLVWCIATVATSGWLPGLYINSSYSSRSRSFLSLWDLAGHPTPYRNQHIRYTNLRDIHIFESASIAGFPATASAAASSPTYDAATEPPVFSRANLAGGMPATADNAVAGVHQRAMGASASREKGVVAAVYDLFYIIDLFETAPHSRWGSAVPVSELRLSRLELLLDSSGSPLRGTQKGNIVATAIPLRRAWAPELMHLQVISTSSDVSPKAVQAASSFGVAANAAASGLYEKKGAGFSADDETASSESVSGAHEDRASRGMAYYAPGSAAAVLRAAANAALTAADAAAVGATAATSSRAAALAADYVLQYENAIERTTHMFTVGAAAQRDTSSFETVLPATVVMDPLALGNDIYGTPVTQAAPPQAAAVQMAAAAGSPVFTATASWPGGATRAEPESTVATAGMTSETLPALRNTVSTREKAMDNDHSASINAITVEETVEARRTGTQARLRAAGGDVSALATGIALRIGAMVEQQGSQGSLRPVAAEVGKVSVVRMLQQLAGATRWRSHLPLSAASQRIRRKMWSMPQFAAADATAVAAANKPRSALYVQTQVQHACARGEFHPSFKQATCRSTCHKVVEYVVQAEDTSANCPLVLDTSSDSSNGRTRRLENGRGNSRASSIGCLRSNGNKSNKTSKGTRSSSGSRRSKDGHNNRPIVVFPCSEDLCSYVEFEVGLAAARANAAAAAVERAAVAAASVTTTAVASRRGAVGWAAPREMAAAGVDMAADAAAAGVVAAARGDANAAATPVVAALRRTAAIALDAGVPAGIIVTTATDALEKQVAAHGAQYSARDGDIAQLLQKAVDRDINTKGPTFFVASSAPAAVSVGKHDTRFESRRKLEATNTESRRDETPTGEQSNIKAAVAEEIARRAAAEGDSSSAERSAWPRFTHPTKFTRRFASPLFLSLASSSLRRKASLAAATGGLFSSSPASSSLASSSSTMLFTQVTYPVAGVADVWEVLLVFERVASRTKDSVLVILHHSEKEEAARLHGEIGGQLPFPVYVRGNTRGIHEAAPGAAVLWTDLDIKAVTALTVRYRSRTHAAALLEMQVKGTTLRCPHNGFFALSTYPIAAMPSTSVIFWGDAVEASYTAAVPSGSDGGGGVGAAAAYSDGLCALQRRKTKVKQLKELDCQGEWTEWSVCSSTCRSTRFFAVRRYALPGGKPCSIFDSKPCTGSPFCSGTADFNPSSSFSPDFSSISTASSASALSSSFTSSSTTSSPVMLPRTLSSALLQEAKQQDCVLQQSAWSDDCVNCRNIRFLHVIAPAAGQGVACPAPEQRVETRFCSAACEKAFAEEESSGGNGHGGGGNGEGGGEDEGGPPTSTTTSTRSTTTSTSSSSTHWKDRLLALPWWAITSTFALNMFVMILLFTVARHILKRRYQSRMQRLIQHERYELAAAAAGGSDEGQEDPAADDAHLSEADASAPAAGVASSKSAYTHGLRVSGTADADVTRGRRGAEAAEAPPRCSAEAAALAEVNGRKGRRRAAGAGRQTAEPPAANEEAPTAPAGAFAAADTDAPRVAASQPLPKRSTRRRSKSSSPGREQSVSRGVKGRQKTLTTKSATSATGHRPQEHVRAPNSVCTDPVFDALV